MMITSIIVVVSVVILSGLVGVICYWEGEASSRDKARRECSESGYEKGFQVGYAIGKEHDIGRIVDRIDEILYGRDDS